MSYYDHTTYPSNGAAGSASAMRAELELIEAGFNKLPTLAGNASKIVMVNAGATALTLAVAGTDYVAPGGALGAPASGNLLNCTFPTFNQNTTGYASALKSATTTVSVSAATAPTVGQVLTATDGATATWQTPATGSSGDMVLASVQSVTGLKTFDPSKLAMKGSSTGVTTFATANASATGYTITFPAVTGTVLTTAAAITPAQGGTGVANGASNTLTFTGNFALGLTLTAGTSVTLPTSGTLAILGANTFTGDQTFGNNALKTVKTIGFNGEYDNGNSSTAVSITLTNGQKQKVTLTATPTITMVTTGATVGAYQLRLIQDATGGRVPTWTGTGYSASRWLGSTSAPAINLAVSGETIVTFFWDGTNLIQSASKVGAV